MDINDPHFVVSGIPNPALKVESRNPNYGCQPPQSRIYRQVPTVIGHINTANLPLPPRPLAGRSIDRTFSTPNEPTPTRRSPSVWTLSRPWDAFLAASTVEHVTVDITRELAARNRGGWCFTGSVVDRLIGPGSVLKHVESRVLPFVRALTPLNIFGVWVDETGLDPSRLLTTLEDMTNPTNLKSQLRQNFRSPERALEYIQQLNHAVDVLEAIDHYAVRVALDACALLGGVELPNWPPSVEFTGTWLEEVKRENVNDPTRYISQCRARDFERWGVPCWIESPRAQYSRLDATADALPTRDREAERRHQRMLQNVPRSHVDTIHIPCIVQPINRTVSAAPLLSPEAWVHLKTAIQLLLDTTANNSLLFHDFSSQMEMLLGQSIWSGNRYEPHQHTNESFCWLKARDGAQESSHLGVIYASMEIPEPWNNPHRLVASKDGIAGFLPDDGNDESMQELGVAADTWFAVEIVGYGPERKDEAARVASSYGALGHRFVQAPYQPRDAEGRTIRRSIYQIELLFKSQRQQQDVCRQVQADLASSNEASVAPVKYEACRYDRLNTFNLVADPHFLNHLYSHSCSHQARQRLLRIAPRYPVPPSIYSTLPDLRETTEAVYLWRLVHFTLFEYDSEFLLPGYRPTRADAEYTKTIKLASVLVNPKPSASTSASGSSVPSKSSVVDPATRRTSLPVAELPLARLGEIAFSPSLPFASEFSEADADRLRRLYLCLCVGARLAPFTASIFPFPGSPYRRLLAAVVGLVEESSMKGIVDYTYHMGPANSSAGNWDEKLSLDRKQRVMISMDRTVEPVWDEDRDLPRVDAYVSRCTKLSGRTRLQKRRRRVAAQKGKDSEGQGDASGPNASAATATSGSGGR